MLVFISPRCSFRHQQYLRCGKTWGSTVAESPLSVQWHVEKTPGNIGGPLDQLWQRIKRREERRERRRRAPEVEGESVKTKGLIKEFINQKLHRSK